MNPHLRCLLLPLLAPVLLGAPGHLDPTFNPPDASLGLNDQVYALAVDSDDSLLIPRGFLARLQNDTSADPGFVEFTDLNLTATEGGPALVVNLRRFSGTQGAVSVFIDEFPSAPGESPATNGVDHFFTPKRVSFADGQSTATVSIGIANDDVIGPTKGFGLLLRDPLGGVTLGSQTSSQVTLLDDDFGVSLQSGEFDVSELGGSVTIVLVRVGGNLNPFSVEVETVPETAQNNVDFLPTRTRVEFSIDSTFGSVSIPVFDNPDPSGSKTFHVRLRDPIGTPNLVAPTDAVVTIRDNERPGGLDATHTRLVRALNLVGFYPGADGSALIVTNRFFNSTRPSRLKPDGTFDADFQPAVTNITTPAALYDDGRILVLGAVGATVGTPLTRLLPDGRRDPDFATNIALGTTFPGLWPQSDGSIYVAANAISQGTVKRTGLARLQPDGQIDPGFTVSNLAGAVKALVTDSQGRIYIGGSLSSVGGVSHHDVVRLLPNGSLDPAYRAQAQPVNPGEMRALALTPDGSLYVGGTFVRFGTNNRPYLVRLTPTGSVDPGFGLEGSGFADIHGTPSVDLLALQSDGRLLVAGHFSRYQDTDLPASLVRLRDDGSLDTGFGTGLIGANATTTLDGSVLGMRIIADSELLIGGHFNFIDGVSWPSVARLYLSTPTGQTPRFDRAALDTDGTVRLHLAGGVNGRYQLESTGDLQTWNPLQILDLTPAILEITDLPPPGTEVRFYRLRSALQR